MTARSLASMMRSYVECREQDEREGSQTAATIDSQSVRSAEKGGPTSIRMAICGQEDQKPRSATFSSIPVGPLMHAIIHSVDIQDRGGGIVLMATLVG